MRQRGAASINDAPLASGERMTVCRGGFNGRSSNDVGLDVRLRGAVETVAAASSRSGAMEKHSAPVHYTDTDHAHANATIGPSLVNKGTILRNGPVATEAVGKC